MSALKLNGLTDSLLTPMLNIGKLPERPNNSHIKLKIPTVTNINGGSTASMLSN